MIILQSDLVVWNRAADSKKPELLPIRALCVRSQVGLLPHRRHIRATAMRNLANHVARVAADHATAQDFSPACGTAVRFFLGVLLFGNFIANIAAAHCACNGGKRFAIATANLVSQ